MNAHSTSMRASLATKLIEHFLGALIVVCVFPSVASTQVMPASTWELRTPSVRPSARASHSMAFFDAMGAVVLYGGVSPTEGLLWVWNGVDWSARDSSRAPFGRVSPNTPRARSWAGVASDRLRGRLVLFGGSVGPELDETWEHDGSQWEQKFPQQRPEARTLFAMAYDPIRRRTVVFGGLGRGGFTNPLYDTWTWDGTTWTQMPAYGPSPRTHPNMAWDQSIGHLVLFGGVGGNLQALNDTWTWNGTAWLTVYPPVSPSPRSLHAMAWHEGRRRVVLFAGRGAFNQMLGDTWEFNGGSGTWEQVSPLQSAPSNWFPEMAYDRLRSRVVLFGGNGGTGDETWTYLDRTLYAAPARPLPGQTVTLFLDSPADPGRAYVLACSFARAPGLPVFPDGRVVSLAPDPLFWWSLGSQTGPFLGFLGTLDGLGRAQASIQLPPDPALIGLRWFVSGVTFDPASPRTILNEVELAVVAP